jgi:hypothetical protein
MYAMFNVVQYVDANITSAPVIVFVFLNWLPLLNPNSDASAESQADVLLGSLPQFGRPQDVLPWYQVQQEQYSSAREVVLQLSVSDCFHIYIY